MENTEEYEMDKLIKNIDSDYGFLNLIKTYQERDYERDEEHEESNTESVMFSNCFIQNSFSKMNILRKIISRQENDKLFYYLELWKSKVSPVQKQEHLLKNRKIIESYINDDYFIEDKILQTNESHNKNVYILAKSIKNIIFHKLQNNYTLFISNLQNFVNTKKIATCNLSLLYLFTELTVSRNKLSKISSQQGQVNPVQQNKLIEYEKKLNKLESCLTEKVSIIEGKNDTIANLSDTIEYLNKKISKIEKNGLNIIEGIY